MSKFNPGDMVEFVPGNYESGEDNKSFWFDGAGIIMDIEDQNYVILVFSLQKISTKNFASYDMGQQVVRLPVQYSDQQNCLRSIEI